MHGWRYPQSRWAGAGHAGLVLPSPEIVRPYVGFVRALRGPLPYVGFARQLPVPNYAAAAELPLTLGRGARPWNLDGMPWSALFVPGELDETRLALFCELLTNLDEIYLRSRPQTPNLYASGVRYQLMPQTEYWLEIPWALAFARAGLGVDCKTLAAWRTAELRVREGQPGARCLLSEHQSASEHVFHVRVQRQDGTIEDPSARLGMRSVIPGSVGLTQQAAGLISWRP